MTLHSSVPGLDFSLKGVLGEYSPLFGFSPVATEIVELLYVASPCIASFFCVLMVAFLSFFFAYSILPSRQCHILLIRKRKRDIRWTDIEAEITTGNREQGADHLSLEAACKDWVTLFTRVHIQCLHASATPR